MPGDTGEKKAWTVEEEFQFLLKLLYHFNPSPSLSNFNFEGRTTKALMHKIQGLKKKYMNGGINNDEQSPISTPKAPKRKATGDIKLSSKKSKNVVLESEEENGTSTSATSSDPKMDIDFDAEDYPAC